MSSPYTKSIPFDDRYGRLDGKEYERMANPVWCVADVEPHEDYTMLITFENGEQRLYDARPLLSKPICASLNNLSFFMMAKAMYGTVVWSDDVDIAPEHLYECSIPVGGAVYA